jgi:DNA repair protein RecN (Recombination protein N)
LKVGAVKGYSKLLSIQIKNLGVIESATINFADGLTVLTGETGAGKTMVLTALSLILGSKSDAKLVRAGSERLIVSAEFQIGNEIADKISEFGALPEDGTLLITRIISSDGKSKATIGGVPVPLNTLSQIGEDLIEIHAQSSSIRLARENVQRELLDEFAGNLELTGSYQNSLARLKEENSRLIELEKALSSREVEISRLREISTLIKKFEIKRDVYNLIENEISRLEAVEDLNKSVTSALEILNGEELNLGVALRTAAKSLQIGRSLDKDLSILVEEFNNGLQTLESVISDLERYRNSLNADPARFDFLQSRKAELVGLYKKYGSVDDKNEAINLIFEESQSANQRIDDLSGGEERLAELRKSRELILKNTIAAAAALSQNREEGAIKLSKLITKELGELSLSGAIFEVEVSKPKEITEKDLRAHGVDSVIFNFSSHKSAKLLPLSKGASGGELSRVMLAIEVVLAAPSKIGTYIFDEVDAGVGGKAAIEVGRKLATVAKNSQVIVVTHLAQVAAWAGNHLVVAKSDKGDFVESSVSLVDGGDRKTEIARLLSGQENSATAREHAGELLDLVGNSALR